MTTIEDATPVESLPENHIFILIHRVYRPDDWSDMRRTIDIGAVIERLNTPEGRRETRQWVNTPLHTRLFIHQICDSDLGLGGADAGGDVLHIDAESASEAIQLALGAYPESIRLTDSAGYLPLHNLCDKHTKLTHDRSIINQCWHSGSKEVINLVIEKYPGGASIITDDGKSALAFVLDSLSDPTGEQGRDDVIMTLLDLDPSVVKVADEDGRYPLHVAAHGSLPGMNITKRLIQLYPQALNMKCHGGSWGGKIPLHSYLRCHHGGTSVESERIVRLMLTASASCASVEDESVLICDQGELDPAGDAMDYLSVMYCSTISNFTLSSLIYSNEDADDFDDRADIAGGFVTASKECLESTEERSYHANENAEDCERTFRLILDACRILDGSIEFRPLHAFCKGSRCRPWYLVVMDQVIKRYPNQARERDECNSLPLHHFLRSCLVEKDRAMQKGYVANDDEYFVAVTGCFRLILDANPNASKEVDEDGLYPLHLAIQTCNSLKFEDILRPILDLAPDTGLAQHPETKLHPFAQASVGSASNVDNAFLLLRQNPSVIGQLTASEGQNEEVGGKRKR